MHKYYYLFQQSHSIPCLMDLAINFITNTNDTSHSSRLFGEIENCVAHRIVFSRPSLCHHQIYFKNRISANTFINRLDIGCFRFWLTERKCFVFR